MFDRITVVDKIMKWVVEDPSMILMIKKKYLNDDIWEYCIEQDGDLFMSMEDPSTEFINKVVKKNGYLVLIALEKWPEKVERATIYYAIKNTPDVLNSIPPKYLDYGLRELAYDAKPSLMNNSDDIRYGYIEKRIHDDPTIIKYIDATEDQICEAIELSPTVCVHIKHFTPKMKALIKDKYPDMYPLLFPEEREN